MKIIIAYDGSEGAVEAIEDLRFAGMPADVEAKVVSIADVAIMVPHVGFDPYLGADFDLTALAVDRTRELAQLAISEAKRIAEQGAERCRRLFPSWKIEAVSENCSPHEGVIKQAEQFKADLIVVGSHGRSALGRAVFGSVSQHILHYAPCSVRIARSYTARNNQPIRPIHLLLGIDGSLNSSAAVAALAARRWPAGTQLSIMSVIDTHIFRALSAADSIAYAWDTAATENAIARLQKTLKAAREDLHNAGMEVNTVLVEGDPKKLLLKQAEETGVDCIFLGAKGHSRMERLLLGSVSSAVAARAHCSVEVIRTAFAEHSNKCSA